MDLREITKGLYDKDFSYFINDIDCITDNIINQTDTIIVLSETIVLVRY